MMLDKFDVKNGKDVKSEEAGAAKAAEPVKPVEVKAPEAAESVKLVEAKAPEAAEPVKPVEVKAPEAAESVKPVEAKETVKETTRKSGYLSEIDGVEVDFELQYRDQETDMKDIARRVTEDYTKRGNDASNIQLIQVYLKPTDFTAYYVINNSYEGKIPLF